MKAIGFETHEILEKNRIVAADLDASKPLEVMDCDEGTGQALRSYIGSNDLSGVTRVCVDLDPELIGIVKEMLPQAKLEIFHNSIPQMVKEEEIRQLEEKFAGQPENVRNQRHIAAVRFAFDERQLGIAGGKLTLRFVMQDLHLAPDVSKRFNKLFDFCQHFMLKDPALREHVQEFLDSPDADSIPESTALIRQYLDEICPAGVPADKAARHVVKETWLKQVERGDEQAPVSYEEIVHKIMLNEEPPRW